MAATSKSEKVQWFRKMERELDQTYGRNVADYLREMSTAAGRVDRLMAQALALREWGLIEEALEGHKLAILRATSYLTGTATRPDDE